MNKTLFTRKLIAIADPAHLGTEVSTMNAQTTTATGRKELEMTTFQELIASCNNLNADEKAKLIGALSATAPRRTTSPSSPLDSLLANASPQRQSFLRQVYCEAQRHGIVIPADGRRLQTSEVDRAIRESGRFLPHDTAAKIEFKANLAAAGFME
jgi:hypothetical protein